MLYLIAIMFGASVGLLVFALLHAAHDADERAAEMYAAETIEQVEPAEQYRTMVSRLRFDESLSPLAGSYYECQACAYRIVVEDDGMQRYDCTASDACYMATSKTARETLAECEPSCEAINEARERSV